MKSVKVSVHVNQDDASTYTFNSVLEGCLAQFFYFISINRIPYFVSMKNPVIFCGHCEAVSTMPLGRVNKCKITVVNNG